MLSMRIVAKVAKNHDITNDSCCIIWQVWHMASIAPFSGNMAVAGIASLSAGLFIKNPAVVSCLFVEGEGIGAAGAGHAP